MDGTRRLHCSRSCTTRSLLENRSRCSVGCRFGAHICRAQAQQLFLEVTEQLPLRLQQVPCPRLYKPGMLGSVLLTVFYKSKGVSWPASAASAANAVYIIVVCSRYVVVEYMGDVFDIYTASCHIGSY